MNNEQGTKNKGKRAEGKGQGGLQITENRENTVMCYIRVFFEKYIMGG